MIRVPDPYRHFWDPDPHKNCHRENIYFILCGTGTNLHFVSDCLGLVSFQRLLCPGDGLPDGEQQQGLHPLLCPEGVQLQQGLGRLLWFSRRRETEGPPSWGAGRRHESHELDAEKRKKKP